MPDLKNQWFLKKVLYSFAIHGGAIGNIVLDAQLPDGLIIQTVIVNIITGVVSGGAATISFGNNTSNVAYLAATAKGSFDTTDKVVAGNLQSAPVKIRNTASTQQLVMAIAAATLTAGAFEVYVQGFIPADTTELTELP